MSDVISDTTMTDVGAEPPAWTFAATGDTTLPLSERDRAWDAGEATGRVKKWASSDGSGDPATIDYSKLARAYFWQDKADGDPKIGDLKFPFADVIGGKLTAVWRGVTSGAQRLSSAKDVDTGAIQKHMAPYYAAAKTKYGDPKITPPWASGSHMVDGEQLAAVRATLADHGADGVLGDDELRAILLAVNVAGELASNSKHRYAGNGGACKICGEAASNHDAHYAAVNAELSDFALLAATTEGTAWQATLCVAGTPTVDSGVKRYLDPDGGSWLPLPLPLGLLDDTPHADVTTRSPVCGRIDTITVAGNTYQATGVFFDQASDPGVAQAGSKAASLVDEMGRMGVSVDLVDIDVELMVWNGSEVSAMDDVNDPTAADMGPDQPGGPATEANFPNDIPDLDDLEDEAEPEYVMSFTQWVIAGATICPVQALTPATISLAASALTAAAAGLAPLEPPLEWFEEPEHDGPTPLTVTDDGQVYGHLATWGTCHTGKPGVCVTAPHSPTGYRNFHRGEIKTAEGDRIDVGVLTMNTGHAGLRLSPRSTVAHYDDTGTQAAHVRATDGQHGIWLAGAINPKLPAEDARLLMASSPSGDWREVNRGEGLDLFAALAVNNPGFPVPRARLVAAGAEDLERVALVAAGMVVPAVDAARFDRELAVLAASADGIEGLAALV